MNDTSGPENAGALDEVDELALVEDAKAGDRTAMDRLIRRHIKNVERLCRRMMRDPFDAEDACQEALLQIARRITTFKGHSGFGTWVYAVTRNICLNEIRSAARRRTELMDEVPDKVVESSEPHDLMAERLAQRLDIDAALSRVTPTFHDPLVLWFFCDMSYKDIADVLDRPLNTIRTQLDRGKDQLAELLQLREPGGADAVSNQPTVNLDAASGSLPMDKPR